MSEPTSQCCQHNWETAPDALDDPAATEGLCAACEGQLSEVRAAVTEIRRSIPPTPPTLYASLAALTGTASSTDRPADQRSRPGDGDR